MFIWAEGCPPNDASSSHGCLPLRYQGYVEDNANRPIHRAQRSTARDLRAIDSDQHPALYSDPTRLSLRSDASHSLRLHPQARLVAQPDRTVVQYPRAPSAQARQLHRREQLNERVLAFIDYFNKTMAKPFKGLHRPTQDAPLWSDANNPHYFRRAALGNAAEDGM